MSMVIVTRKKIGKKQAVPGGGGWETDYKFKLSGKGTSQEKVALKQRLERNEGVNHVLIWEKTIQVEETVSAETMRCVFQKQLGQCAQTLISEGEMRSGGHIGS